MNINVIEDINNVTRINLNSYPEKSVFSKKQKLVRLVNRMRGTHQKGEGFSWPNAFLAQSLEFSHKLNSASEDLDYLINYYDRWYSKGVPIDNLDNVMNGKTLIYLYRQTNNEKYRKMIDILIEFISNHKKDKLQSLPYRPNSTDYIFVDSLGMICPFLTQYGKIANDESFINLSVSQLVNFIEYGFDSDSNLPYHAYSLGEDNKKGIIGWGRAVGWFLIGIIDTLEYLSNTHSEYEKLKSKYIEVVTTVLKYQKLNGAFPWQLQAKDGMNDSSATAMIGYSIIKGIKLNLLSNSYLDVVSQMIHYLISVTENGYVMESSAECMGLGMYPQRQGWNPWSQGPTGSLISQYLNFIN